MPGLKNLGTRLMYHGGYRQEDRMRMDKLRTLHKALLYSYQAETIEYGGQQYRCLINPSKNIMDYDNKEISINQHEENTIPRQSIVIDTKEGWLQKESRYRKVWRNRWCVLDSNTFCTYENENKAKETERIEVRTITMVGNEYSKNCFCFVSISIIIYSLLK